MPIEDEKRLCLEFMRAAMAGYKLITLYTGARLEELCQLTLDDIKTEGAIHYPKIMDLSNDKDPTKPLKRLKNAASRRVVPLHSVLIKAGFLDYVEHQRTNHSVRLFPALKPDAKYSRLGTNWSKWWSRWRREIGIDGNENVFHAFRHVFKTQCRTSKIEEQFSDALTGHSSGGIGRAYGKFELEALDEAMQKLEYPKLKLYWVWKFPVQLKTWIDAIARAGVTFRYTASGPEGLVKGKKIYVALARGGVYRDTPIDAQVPYFRNVLGFLGITDVEFIYAEGMALGVEVASKAFAEAESAIAELIT